MAKRTSMFKQVDPLLDYIRSCVSQPHLAVDEYELDKVKKGAANLTLHSSSLPACPVHLFLRAVQRRVNIRNFKEHGVIPVGESEVPMGTLGTMGRVRHELIQNTVGRGNRVLGNWWSRRHEKLYRICTYEQAVERSGDVDLEYQEIGFRLSLAGHPALSIKMDGVFLHDDELWVLDYKFKTYGSMKSELPTKGSVLQQRAYVAACRRYFKTSRLKHVVGYVLVHCQFDNTGWAPSGTNLVWQRVDDKANAKMEQFLESQAVGLHAANKAASKAVDEKKPKTAVAKILGHRLCPSRKHYEQRVCEYLECPWVKHCHGPKMQDRLLTSVREVLAS